MQDKYVRVGSLVAAFMMVLCAWSVTSAEEALRYYKNIPFKASTPDSVRHTLFEMVDEISMDDNGNYTLDDYGYELTVKFYFKGDKADINKIVLKPTGELYGVDEAFRQLVIRDVERFVDLETKLIEQYGEPEFRFFYTDGGKYGKPNLTRFMFADPKWNEESLLAVFDEDAYLVAHSVWGNLMLRLWANGINERTRGYLTKVDIIFDATDPWKTVPEMQLYPRWEQKPNFVSRIPKRLKTKET